MGYDSVHKPSHYTEGRKYEPKDVIRDWGLNFNLGNAVKYLARAGRKDDIVQDLKKAQEYIQFEIDAIEAVRAETTGGAVQKAKREQAKADIKSVKEMLNDPEPKCTLKPIFAEMADGKGVSCGVLEVTMPKNADPESVIKAVMKKLYGGE